MTSWHTMTWQQHIEAAQQHAEQAWEQHNAWKPKAANLHMQQAKAHIDIARLLSNQQLNNTSSTTLELNRIGESLRSMAQRKGPS